MVEVSPDIKNGDAGSSQDSGFLLMISEWIPGWLANLPEENLAMARLLTQYVFNQPVRDAPLDRNLFSKISPLDQTQNKLLLLHVCLIDYPLKSAENLSKVNEMPISVLQQLKRVSDNVNRILTKDFKLSALVSRAKLANSNFSDLSIQEVPQSFEDKYRQNRKLIFNILLFKELMKSLANTFNAKAKTDHMLQAYENAAAEDAALEAAITVTRTL